MSEHHLFREKPPIELVCRIFKPLGINIYDLPTQFTKSQAVSYKWSEEDLVELIPYYYPSMLSRFFENEYPKNNVTIFRQLVKASGLEFKTLESMSEGKKTNLYYISRPSNTVLSHPIIITFD